MMLEQPIGHIMKTTLFIILLITGAGCVRTDSAFVQDGIRIVPPVEIEYTGFINDGGTLWFKMTDANKKVFDVYADHRIGIKTPSAIYLNAYPEYTNSVRVIDQATFRRVSGDLEKYPQLQLSKDMKEQQTGEP
jgi:hypothetical protein